MKRWRIALPDAARIADLERAAGIPNVVAQLLINRGVTSPAAAREFLEPKLADLRDPALLPGVPGAVEVLQRAIAERRKIVIYGDYDADGMTASAILVRAFRALGVTVRSYVPHRLEEGYGLNTDALRRLASEGAQVVVTVDCGVASAAEADVARTLGLELVITDHHEFGPRLPDAAAIVHPRLPGHDYPFAGLCGAAVAFKLAWALCQAQTDGRRVSDPLKKFLMQAVGLAAIGAVADVVPLIDENRVLVRHGVASLRAYPVPGIAALEQVANLSQKPALDGEDLGFAIAPRLNAAGRLGRAELGVELLATDSPERAMELAKFVDELNAQRQAVERSVLLAARKQVKQRFDPAHDAAFVLADHDWHPGVIGIVAGRLAEQYQRPVVMVSLDKTGVKPGIGSGRSVPGCDLHAALAHCTEHLESHGGHAAAAGFRIAEPRVDRFRQAFVKFVAERLGDDRTLAEVPIDAEAPLAAMTLQTVRQIEQLAPFGFGNDRPVLCTRDVRVAAPPKRMGAEGKHLSVELEQHGVKLRAVAFGAGDWADELQKATGPLEIAYRPVLNTFRGWQTVEMRLEDWRVEPTP